jgi:hypothetical protein
MSTFKVLLVSITFGILLFALMLLLSAAVHELFLIPTVAMVCVPCLAIIAGRIRQRLGESKLWAALAVAGFLAPLTWCIVLVVSLMRSDI